MISNQFHALASRSRAPINRIMMVRARSLADQSPWTRADQITYSFAMKLRDAAIAWTPREGVKVIHWMEKHTHEKRIDVGSMELPPDRYAELLLWFYVTLTHFEEIESSSVHRAFLKIDEYKDWTRDWPFGVIEQRVAATPTR